MTVLTVAALTVLTPAAVGVSSDMRRGRRACSSDPEVARARTRDCPRRQVAAPGGVCHGLRNALIVTMNLP